MTVAVEQAFAAQSVAPAAGVHVAADAVAAVVTAPSGVPRVIVIDDPIITIVELSKLRLAVV
ncbi:MAG TPA: hypothetical protein VLB31_00925 [Actinomycetota bacterium]|nr:hypothetical protein [Actinomycetota bacterium]